MSESKVLEPNPDQIIVFPRMRGEEIEMFSGALNVDGKNFDIELTSQIARSNAEYLRISGKCRDDDTTITGALFDNASGLKKNDKAPNMTGTIELNRSRPDEKRFRVSVWQRTSKANGNPFLSGPISPDTKKEKDDES